MFFRVIFMIEHSTLRLTRSFQIPVKLLAGYLKVVSSNPFYLYSLLMAVLLCLEATRLDVLHHWSLRRQLNLSIAKCMVLPFYGNHDVNFNCNYYNTPCPKKHVATFSTITLTISVRLQ